MRKAERLFQVVNLIRVHQPITAQALAQRLQVSVRSIYRYIDDLSLGGIPIYGEPGLGYAMQAHFEMPPLALGEEELEVLTAALDLLAASLGGKSRALAQALLAKIEAAAPASARAQPAKRLFALQAPVPEQNWEALHAAIKLDAAVRIRYLSLAGESSTRTIYPLGLFYWGGKWTVGSWCCTRADYRDFRLDRILEVQAPQQTPPCQAGIGLGDYMRRQADAWAARQATDSTLSAGQEHAATP
ncbi:YafY family protein [Pseudomonas sp. AA-38]|uniref:helix-turn-helix transcriptional regulator n=1 Tax=Pseudomonas sp. AA-38 TaxID=3028807 RepID=UPI0023F766FF|nr:YafY family protein [Pseudomonas sp. AA-38]